MAVYVWSLLRGWNIEAEESLLGSMMLSDGAIDELLTIAQEASLPAEIYHLKAGGTRNWGKTPLAMAKIDSARAAGVDVQADMYPYTAGATGLSACFPPWASADGKLSQPEIKAPIKPVR